MAQNNRGKGDPIEQEENVSPLFTTPSFQQVMDTRADKPVNVLKLSGQHRGVIGVKLRVKLIWVPNPALRDIDFVHEHITFSY